MVERLLNSNRVRENPAPFIQSIHRGTQRYFHLCNVESSGKNKGSKQIFLTTLKIVSYVTIVIPFFMFVLKVSLDSFYKTGKVTSSSVKKQEQSQIQQTLEKKTLSTENSLPPLVQNPPTPLIEKPNSVTQSVETNVPPLKTSTVADLMEDFTKAWNEETATFDFEEPFDAKYFVNMLSSHTEKFKKVDFDETQHYGYIEKLDLDPSENPRIYIRADLHGDLKSLIENLRTLQKEGLLDENYKCKKGTHLVFLGDYCDRGIYGTQILELLIRLREENLGQVHLIRGNHEYASMNGAFAVRMSEQNNHSQLDRRLIKVFCCDENDIKGWNHLDNFYKTMPLATYISMAGPIKEYILCSHGLFEPSMDPSSLLDQNESNYVLVPKERKLSERISKISKDSSLTESAERIKSIVEDLKKFGDTKCTAYNWGDIYDKSHIGSPDRRKFILNANDIKHYLKLSSVHHKVKILFRGHQHKLIHHTIERPQLDQMRLKPQSIVATTLPAGADIPHFLHPDCAYILKPAAKVKNWEKKAIQRNKSQNRTNNVAEFFPIYTRTTRATRPGPRQRARRPSGHPLPFFVSTPMHEPLPD